MPTIYVNGWAAWAPNLETSEDWRDWSIGKKNANDTGDYPALSHLPPLARRRLSQITRMVLEVGYNILLKRHKKSLYTFLCSQFGEFNQQLTLIDSVIEEDIVKPGNFSLSVFNTPFTMLSIYEELLSGVSVILAGEATLAASIGSVVSHLASSLETDTLLIFADEHLPLDYQSKLVSYTFPFAFACIFSTERSTETEFRVDYHYNYNIGKHLNEPLDFLRWIISPEKSRVWVSQEDFSLGMNRLGNE